MVYRVRMCTTNESKKTKFFGYYNGLDPLQNTLRDSMLRQIPKVT